MLSLGRKISNFINNFRKCKFHITDLSTNYNILCQGRSIRMRHKTLAAAGLVFVGGSDLDTLV